MKRRTHLSPKQLLLFALALLLFTAIILFCFSRTEDQNEAFQNLSRELFLSEVTGNTLNMHYTIADPGRFGITDYSPCLPCYLPGQATSENAGRRELICRLEKLHPQKLSDENRLTYTLLHNSLCLEDAMEQYPYFSEPLGPHSGMQTQLPILLSEYTFRTVRDIEDYLALLEQSDEYLTSLLTYEQEKAAAGAISYPELYESRPYLNIPEWSVKDVDGDLAQCGLSGSPTKVKTVQNIVFQAKESKTLTGSDKDGEDLIVELLANHTIG